MRFEALEKRDLQRVQRLTHQQGGNLPVLVHPFFNLLRESSVANAPEHATIRAELFRKINTRRANSAAYIRSLRTPIFSSKRYPGYSIYLDEMHQEYCDKLLRFLAQTTLGILCIFEVEENVHDTERIIKDTGFSGTTVFIPTEPASPAPVSNLSFEKVSDTLLGLQLSRLVVGGQNSWLPIADYNTDKPEPLILDPSQGEIEQILLGCVGATITQLHETFKTAHEIRTVKRVPTIQLSSHVFPQRRSSDVSTLLLK